MADPKVTSGTYKSAKYTTYNFSTQKYQAPTTPVAQKLGVTIPPPTRPQNVVYWGQENGDAKYIDTNVAYNLYGLLEPKAQKKLADTMDRFYGKGRWKPDWIPKFWGRSVNIAQTALQVQGRDVNPLNAFDQLVSQSAEMGINPDGNGGGGGGGSSAPKATVNLTDPDTAKVVVDQALQTYLGRAANERELATFTAALTRQEMKNPNRVDMQGGTAVTSGGVNPQAYAQEFAQAQEGAAEYGAATTFLDAFIESLDNPIGLT